MEDSQMASRMSSMAITDPRPSFPLPRELRDHIYQYLLDGDYTRVTRDVGVRSGPRIGDGIQNAYHFHTKILAVNRAIHDEAEEILYNRNTFIVASLHWPGIETENSDFAWTPFLAKNLVNGMQKHTLRLQVYASRYYSEDGIRGEENPTSTYLFLARDMQVFCHNMGLQIALLGSRAIVLRKDSTEAMQDIEIDKMSRMPLSFTLELRNTKYRKSDEALQHRLLDPFKNVISGGLRRNFIGFICDQAHIANLKAVMGPDLFCSHTSTWQYCEGLVHIKGCIDTLVREDHPFYAAFALTNFCARVRATLVNESGNTQHFDGLEQELGIPDGLAVLYGDALLMLGWIRLSMRDFARAARTIVDFGRLLRLVDKMPRGRATLPKDMLVFARHFQMLSITYVRSSDLPEMTVWQALQILREPGASTVAHCRHDRLILERVIDVFQPISRELLPYEESSLTQLPIPRISFCTAMPCFKKPASYVGWQDVELIRSLDQGLRDRIRAMQRSHGLRVTDFDKI